METTRDLARAEPWRESLQRSRERRGSSKDPQGGPGRPKLGPTGIAALAVLAAIIAGSLGGGGAQNAPTAARADVPRAAVDPARTDSPRRTHGGSRAGVSGMRGCALAVVTDGYVNPLANAAVKPERIDQGVDYAGSGTLVAMGSARVTHVATSNTGWPGAFIEYKLLGGADAGCSVFYAEGVIPADGLRVGEAISAGQPIASIIPTYPTGIEIGWGAANGTDAYASVAGQWRGDDDQKNVATAAGKNFSALIAALGGPPGKVEG